MLMNSSLSLEADFMAPFFLIVSQKLDGSFYLILIFTYFHFLISCDLFSDLTFSSPRYHFPLDSTKYENVVKIYCKRQQQACM